MIINVYAEKYILMHVWKIILQKQIKTFYLLLKVCQETKDCEGCRLKTR